MTTANDNIRQTRCQRLDRLARILCADYLNIRHRRVLEREYEMILREVA